VDVRGRHARFDRSIACSEAALIAVLCSEVSYLAWLTVAGALLLTMALSSAYIKRVPISTSIIYLAAGVALGPLGFDAVRLDVREQVSTWFERLTEGAVIVSLFVSGAKLRLPLRSPAWRAPLRLAGPLMLWTIAGVAAFCHFAFDLPWGAALLLGASSPRRIPCWRAPLRSRTPAIAIACATASAAKRG